MRGGDKILHSVNFRPNAGACVQQKSCLLLIGLGLLVAGCAAEVQKSDKETIWGRPAGQGDRNVSVAIGPAKSDTPVEGEGRRVEYFTGSGVFVAPQISPVAEVTSGQNGGFALNFTNADIRTVFGAIVSDILHRAYLIDPSVQGTITLQSSADLSEQQLLPALETALATKGLTILEEGDVLHLVPTALAPKRITEFPVARPESAGLPTFGIQLVPLNHVPPKEMADLIRPFAPQDGILRVDNARRMLILAGTTAEMRTMLNAVRTFDVDWMEGMSFAMYRVRFVEAEKLAKELLELFGDPDTPIAGQVRLIPVPRLNAILGIAADISILKRVESWIERLDVHGSSEGRRIYVYKVQNGNAADLASSLAAITGASTFARATPPAQDRVASSSSLPRSSSPDTQTQGRTPGNARPTTQGSGLQAGRNSSHSANLNTNQTQDFAGNGLRIVPNVENNSLLILATPTEFGVIEAAIKQIDTPPRQVLIEASIAEVTLNNDLRYGLQWFFEQGNNTLTFSSASSGAAASTFPGFSYVFDRMDARVVLNALESVTDVKVLSSPKLLVLNNQSATLQVGDQVPIIKTQAVSVVDANAPIVNSVEFRDTGVILTVRPRINDSGLILMDIFQEVSDVTPTTTSGIDSPTIQQRRLTSTIAVRNGETLALGGLIRETQSENRSGLPLLSHIPVLGNLFKTTNHTRRRTELIVLLTPRVMRDPRETEEAMEYLRRQFRNVAPLTNP